ncbi:MAG: hypothetical protein IPG74_03440 [Flavobacteriales bacterium]|nr:hypothetical protein [Flavobacteriales bacterium]
MRIDQFPPMLQDRARLVLRSLRSIEVQGFVEEVVGQDHGVVDETIGDTREVVIIDRAVRPHLGEEDRAQPSRSNGIEHFANGIEIAIARSGFSH